jgi:hypothetical protein
MAGNSKGLTVRFDNFTLCLRHIINPASMDLVPGPEQAFPAGNGVGTNHRVRRSEVEACIFGSPTVCVYELKAMLGCYLVEVGLGFC